MGDYDTIETSRAGVVRCIDPQSGDWQVRVTAVIDLMGGVVVRGVGGRREEYRAVRSILAPEPSPASIAGALVERFAAEEVYVADLDAISGCEPDWQSYGQIAARGLRPWIDAGVTDADSARSVAEYLTSIETGPRVIVGLESIAGPAALQRVVSAVGAEALVFSLDLKQGRPLTRPPHWQGATAEEIAADVVDLDIRRLIVLDLADVGGGHGTGTLQLCRRLRRRHGNIELIAGGGVRGPDDLRRFEDAGVDRALVASALHDGRLTRDDLAAVTEI